MTGLLASPLGLLIGLALGALGGGGSVLAVPALVYVAGQTPQAATATSLVVVGLTSVGGLWLHARNGHVVWTSGAVFGAAGIVGSLLGTRLNQALAPQALLLAFAVLMLVVAGVMLRRGNGTGQETAEDETGPRSRLRTAGKVAVLGSSVGLLTGLFGVGGGFVVVPALALALGFSMPLAIGTSLLVIIINTVTALLARLAGPGVEWAVALPFSVAGLLGVWAGTRLADRLPAAQLTRAFALLLIAVAAYQGFDAARSLL
ncbi:MAG: sulfite exporter TauE/SafE family protein [Egibacteraceae bacterium]